MSGPEKTTVGAVDVTATDEGVKAISVRTMHGEELRLAMWQRDDDPPVLWIQGYYDPEDPPATGPLDGDANYALDPQAAQDLGMWLGVIGARLQEKWDDLGVTFEHDDREAR